MIELAELFHPGDMPTLYEYGGGLTQAICFYWLILFGLFTLISQVVTWIQKLWR